VRIPKDPAHYGQGSMASLGPLVLARLKIIYFPGQGSHALSLHLPLISKAFVPCAQFHLGAPWSAVDLGRGECKLHNLLSGSTFRTNSSPFSIHR
jgi:hypothetical protein